MSKFDLVIEVCQPDSVSCCTVNGYEINRLSRLGIALIDCIHSGDCLPDCEAFLKQFNPDFRIVKQTSPGKYENLRMTIQDKAAIVQAIWFESDDLPLTDENKLNAYLVFEAAHYLDNE